CVPQVGIGCLNGAGFIRVVAEADLRVTGPFAAGVTVPPDKLGDGGDRHQRSTAARRQLPGFAPAGRHRDRRDRPWSAEKPGLVHTEEITFVGHLAPSSSPPAATSGNARNSQACLCYPSLPALV